MNFEKVWSKILILNLLCNDKEIILFMDSKGNKNLSEVTTWREWEGNDKNKGGYKNIIMIFFWISGVPSWSSWSGKSQVFTSWTPQGTY